MMKKISHFFTERLPELMPEWVCAACSISAIILGAAAMVMGIIEMKSK